MSAQNGYAYSFAIDRIASLAFTRIRSIANVTVNDGFDNTSIGYETGKSLLSEARRNIIIGDHTGSACTTGSDNVFIGADAALALTVGGSTVVIGSEALPVGTTCTQNVGVGKGVFSLLTSGAHNTAVGYTSCNVTTGASNTVVGSEACPALTTGSNNTSIGKSSGSDLTTGSQNTFVGFKTGWSMAGVSRGTCVGYWTVPFGFGADNAINDDITLVGYYAGGGFPQAGTLFSIAGGTTVVGAEAGSFGPVGVSTEGTVCAGKLSAGQFVAPATGSVFLGSNTGYAGSANPNNVFNELHYCVVLGFRTAFSGYFGNPGGAALAETAYTTGTYENEDYVENQRITLIGRTVTDAEIDEGVSPERYPHNIVGIGRVDFNPAPFQVVLGGAGSRVCGYGAIVLGFGAGDNALISTFNSGYVAHGHNPYSIIAGYRAARYTFGSRSVIMGENAHACDTLVAVGAEHFYPNSGSDVFIGSQVASEVYGFKSDTLVDAGGGEYTQLYSSGPGTYPEYESVVLGARACSSTPCMNFGQNVVIGADASFTSSHSVLLGAGASNADARLLTTAGDGHVIIGPYSASGSSAFSSATLFVSNGNTTSPLLSGAFDNDTMSNQSLQVNGDTNVVGDVTYTGTLSDARVKEKVTDVDADHVAADFAAVRFVSFKYKDGIDRKLDDTKQGTQLGVIAQEVHSLFDGRIVKHDASSDLLRVDYTRLMTAFLVCTQQVSKSLDTLDMCVADLKSDFGCAFG